MNKTFGFVILNLFLIRLMCQHDTAAVHNSEKNLEEITVTGTLKEISKSDNPVPLQIIQSSFFQKNPAPNILESISQVSGLRPQVNCNICGTGDIHINGMEGPYTMILIDGMPLVGGLASVYGLMGIPRTLMERMEVLKGAASSLYGSEAMGGIINLITKKTSSYPKFTFDYMATTLHEHTADIGAGYAITPRLHALSAIHSHYYNRPLDLNRDQFTDFPVQKRISVFQKFSAFGKNNGYVHAGGRFFTEYRWGGDMRWNPTFAGSDSIYGESIRTLRWEVFGSARLPFKANHQLWFSLNNHLQQSHYGNTLYDAVQKTYFLQWHHDFKIKKHDFLTGISTRYDYYDDNTVATEVLYPSHKKNLPYAALIPAAFVQWEHKPHESWHMLAGLRADFHPVHKFIPSPRLAIKKNFKHHLFLRLNAGTGFRVVNLFTEEHASLTGARTVEIKEALKPERSQNISLTLTKKIYARFGVLELEGSLFYTYFQNRILPDYQTDVQKIIYDNLQGHAEAKGITLSADLLLSNRISFNAGINFLDNTFTENGITQRQMLSERFSAVWNASFPLSAKHGLHLDYTGNAYGPMLLPRQGESDPRPEESPFYSLHNVQLTWKNKKGWELYAGVKNIFDWVPWKHTPFLIPRTHDPFDKNVLFNSEGKPLPTAENPFGLVFDPSYVYAPNVGRRFFAGIRVTIK
ncbi:MAG: TonB-dependent receptor [Bacteroidia bacterium]|nr:TonB-dependent receptor [Bacteroidia bacterium]